MNSSNIKCETPVNCGDHETGIILSADKIKVRGLEYYYILQSAYSVGAWPSEYIDNLVEIHFNSGDIDYCDWVRYCPLTLGVSFQASAPWLGEFEGGSVNEETGCVSVDCGTFGDYNFCTLDFPEDLFPDYTQEFDPCIPISRSLYALIIAHEKGLLDELPNYNGSDLEQFIEANIINPAAKCAMVSFCCTDTGIDLFPDAQLNLEYWESKCGQK